MIVFPNCKINLGLHILGKREDGYHNLETVFYPLNLTDILELLPTKETSNSFSFSQSGLTVEGSSSDNLCVKAYQLLKKDFPNLPAMKLHLHKAIPMGAGLGGGSADGAFTLGLLNDKFFLQLDEKALLQYAAALGSDGPFFIINKPCYAGGRGELLEPVPISLKGYHIVLINPGIHISTAWAFAQLTPALPENDLRKIIAAPIDTWRSDLKNDFEGPVFQAHPEIGNIKETLYQRGAIYAAMSGSGSTVFGIFREPCNPDWFPGKNYYIRQLAG
ncbi:MAG: 4-(cytidine 5'-diphospho)-2-C-methyl-D-erythritol kinase [Chitinophagaceae bacterium]